MIVINEAPLTPAVHKKKNHPLEQQQQHGAPQKRHSFFNGVFIDGRPPCPKIPLPGHKPKLIKLIRAIYYSWALHCKRSHQERNWHDWQHCATGTTSLKVAGIVSRTVSTLSGSIIP